jgi:hypothetical protein
MRQRKTNRVSAAWRYLGASAFAAFAIVAPGAYAADQAPQSVVYFRYARSSDCNVYMNYSFHAPHFSLMASQPEALSPRERAFLSDFNAAFERLAHERLAVCDLPAGAWFMPHSEQERRYAVCTAAETRLGIAEAGWPQSRLPAISNCVSPKLASPGTVSILPRLREPPMSLASWLAIANAGR